jgi:cation diffusion facilitator CzcD-associated flavoprotein CzcO
MSRSDMSRQEQAATEQAPADPARTAGPADVKFAIIGTGFSGLGAAIALRRAGHLDMVVLERADDVGGTWRDNSYPGCRCDVQSNLYSFSFAPKPDWSETFPSQPELRAYLREVTDRFGLRPVIRFGHEVTEVRWDDPAARWVISTSQGDVRACYVIAGNGFLVEPSVPAIPGIETFTGAVMHSARWDQDWSAAGRRIAVIGTGASAIQIAPEIRPAAQHLTVFQRTPAYVMPHTNRPVRRRERALYTALPVTQRAARALTYWQRELLAIGFVLRPQILARAEIIWRRHMERSITDPRMREQLTPGYRLGCKRVLPSNDFYPALAAGNVALVTEPITEITADAVVTADGTRHPADTIIWATGFHVTDNPMLGKVTGRGGRTLAAAFGQTYLGTVVPGFPGYFQLTGANTGLGHSSIVYMIESQLAYIIDAIGQMEAACGARDVRPDVAAAYNARLQRRLPGTVWGTGCRSWYLDSAGRNLTLWPGFTFDYRRRTRRCRPRDFVTVRPG